MSGWDGQERRLFEINIREIIEVVIDKKFAEHEVREQAAVDARIERLKRELVPNGELLPHKQHHQSLLDAAIADKAASEAKLEFYETAKSAVLQEGIKGVVSVFRAIAVLGVIYVAYKVGIAIPEWMIK